MDALGVDLSGLLTQIVSFSVLFAVLYLILYKPVLQMLDRRADKIKESLETAQRTNDEAARAQQEMSIKMDQARAEGQTMINQAREVADRFREEELTKARQEIASERERAEADIQRERDSAIEELRTEFADLTIQAAQKIIAKSINKSDHHDLIEDVLAQSSKIPRE